MYRLGQYGEVFYKCDFCNNEDLCPSDMAKDGQFVWEREVGSDEQLQYKNCCLECLMENPQAQLEVDGYEWCDQ